MVTPMPWYKEGLPFKCTGCGACCTGAPGYVWVTREEINQLAETLHLTPEIFIQKYTRRIGHRLSLIEDSKTFDCVFLKDKKCTVYSARPKQCRTFPWWKENLTDRAAWEEAASRCEGINHPESEIVPLSVIQDQLT